MSTSRPDYSGGITGTNDARESVLVAATANELASPLVLVRQLGLALTDSTLSTGDREQLVQQLTLTSERALRTVANLTMSSHNQLSLPLEPINAVCICNEVVHELTPLFAAHGQRITLRPRTRSPLFVGNRQLLRQILLAFADNALYYGSAERPVGMTIQLHRDIVRIGVRDHGPAIPIDLWDRLDAQVARHAKAPLATRPQVSSVGLLAARHLADLMGSTVGAIRHHNGATFYVDMRTSHQMSLL